MLAEATAEMPGRWDAACNAALTRPTSSGPKFAQEIKPATAGVGNGPKSSLSHVRVSAVHLLALK